MAHPQNNFTSKFQSDDTPPTAALTLIVNDHHHVYTPSGNDETVTISEPVVFEMADSPTYAEVREIVTANIPCYLHIAGTGVDYMVPYVGGANDSGLRFAFADTQNKLLRWWLCLSNNTWQSGEIEINDELGYLQINRRWSDSASPAKAKLCELTLASILSNNCYSFALSMALVLTNNGGGDCPCESGVFDLAVNILSSGNVYRAEGRWHGYSYDGHENQQARVIEDITVAWSPDHTKLEVWASLSKYFTGASSLSVSALLNQGSYYNRATSSGLTELKKPWQFENAVKFITSATPDPTYTLSTFVTKLDSDILELYIEDPELTGIHADYYAMVTSGAYKTSVLKYGSDPTYSIAYLALSGTTTTFVNYNTSTSTITVFDVSPTEQYGYHAITKTEHTLDLIIDEAHLSSETADNVRAAFDHNRPVVFKGSDGAMYNITTCLVSGTNYKLNGIKKTTNRLDISFVELTYTVLSQTWSVTRNDSVIAESIQGKLYVLDWDEIPSIPPSSYFQVAGIMTATYETNRGILRLRKDGLELFCSGRTRVGNVSTFKFDGLRVDTSGPYGIATHAEIVYDSGNGTFSRSYTDYQWTLTAL